jgi:hypothetical protein
MRITHVRVRSDNSQTTTAPSANGDYTIETPAVTYQVVIDPQGAPLAQLYKIPGRMGWDAWISGTFEFLVPGSHDINTPDQAAEAVLNELRKTHA